MPIRFRLALLLFLSPAVLAQGDGCGAEGEEDDPEIVVDGGGKEGEIDIAVDPFEELPDVDEPNRPPAIKVGDWSPPELKADARRELEALLKLRDEQPGDVGIRYRLAEFYLKHGWFPQSEAEFLACVRLDSDSIRPWEGLLRVYAARPEAEAQPDIVRLFPGFQIQPPIRPDKDWLESQIERDQRITRAWSEIIKRRPDDVARRRLFLDHLKRVREFGRIEAEAREILRRLPDDADTRFDFAEAVRRRASMKEKERAGSGAAEVAESFRLFEENLRVNPDHPASALRLARLLAVRDGVAAEERIAALEARAFLNLFVRAELASVPYRADTLRMARDLVGPDIANRLWDEAMGAPKRTWNDNRAHYRRWIYLHFPNAQVRDRMRSLDKLARRGDRLAAAMMVCFLWHLRGIEEIPEQGIREDQRDPIEQATIDAAVRLGAACYPAAERFLKQAEKHHHRARSARLMRGLRDKRAVRPLVDAMAWETEKLVSYGIAATLEELGDPQAIDALVDAALDVRRPQERRREAAEALAAFKDARCVEAFRRLSKEEGFELVSNYGLFRVSADAKAKEHLMALLRTGADAKNLLRLLEKCENPDVESLLLAGLETMPPDTRPHLIEVLKKRFWVSAQPKVKAFLLKAAEEPGVSDFTIGLLGEMGGPEAADQLLKLVESLKGARWATAARALASTGDPRAVRYFSRVRIVEKDPGKRKLAGTLYEEAAAKRAERERSRG